MNRWDSEATIQNANVDRRVRKQISRGIDYSQYVFAYGWKHGAAWFAFGFAVTLAVIFLDTRLSGYHYDTAEWVIMPLVFGVVFGAPVFSVAIMSRRVQYDEWVYDTVEVQNDMMRAAPPVRESVRPWEKIQNESGKIKTIKTNEGLNVDLLTKWAEAVLSRAGDGQPIRLVRDDIPAKLFGNEAVTSAWSAVRIQDKLVRLGWAYWENKRGSSEPLLLSDSGRNRLEDVLYSPTP
jgi:hypothetical protein